MPDDNDIFSFLKGFKDKNGDKLKDRMKTVLMRARNQYGLRSASPNKEKFLEEIAKDYINLFNEIKDT